MKSLLAGFVVVVTGGLLAAAPALALDGPGRALLASNNVQITDKDVHSVTGGGFASTQFIPPYSGTVRVKWDVKSKDGGDVLTELEVQHVSHCEKGTASTAYVTQTCDIRVTGGLLLTVRSRGTVDNTAFLRNVSLSYKIVDFDGQPFTYEIPAID